MSIFPMANVDTLFGVVLLLLWRGTALSDIPLTISRLDSFQVELELQDIHETIRA